MGWAVRANPRVRQIRADLAVIRRLLNERPEILLEVGEEVLRIQAERQQGPSVHADRATVYR